MDIKANRMDILNQVECGEMTPEEAARWLAALDRVQAAAPEHLPPAPAIELPAAQPTVEPPTLATQVPQPPLDPLPIETAVPVVLESGARVIPEVLTPEPSHSPVWRGWWLVVFVPGLLLVLAAVNWMYAGFLAAGLGWGVWFSLIPLIVGVVLLWLGWELRQARWFYLRLRQRPGARPRELILSFPLPVGLVTWAVRRFGRFSAMQRGANGNVLFEDLNQMFTEEGPIHIFVDDPGGGQVEIWVDGPGGKSRK